MTGPALKSQPDSMVAEIRLPLRRIDTRDARARKGGQKNLR